MSAFPIDEITLLRQELASHPIYEAITNIDELSIFMQHHVYGVWDFMSVVKYLQNHIASTQTPWLPSREGELQRFINNIVLEEESDEGMPSPDGTKTYTSHFNLYIDAMEEVKEGSSQTINHFIKTIADHSFLDASKEIPQPAKLFMQTTFGFIQSNKPHVVAATFALGREYIIPQMFRVLLEKMDISPQQAKVFHYYLDRHIELDKEHHGPLSLKLLNLLCQEDECHISEAKEAGIVAIKARIALWDSVLLAIKASRD